MKSVTILGSTGSVGVNTLRVVAEHPEEFRVDGLAAGSQTALLEEQIRAFHPKSVFVKDSTALAELQSKFAGKIKFYSEKDGLKSFSTDLNSDILVVATTGTSALMPVLEAIRRKKRVALANKEILVMAGGIVMQALRESPGATLIPVDSEHSAIFQCLQGNPRENLSKIILTGTGGPLREVTPDRFGTLTKEIVINHPKWKMGKKISVDSATLMNKGLEIIEASWLFDVPIEKIEVLIHPEAVIHSMVEFMDGALLAQLGVTDMRLPIVYALGYPGRLPMPASLRLNFAEHSRLNFFAPDKNKFPCLELAYEAARQSGSAPCVLSAADEVAVGAFLEDRIHFIQIPQIIEKVMSSHRHVKSPDLSQIQSIHDWAVEETKKLCQAR